MKDCITRNVKTIKSEYEINGIKVEIEQRLLTDNEVDQFKKEHMDVTQDPEVFKAIVLSEKAESEDIDTDTLIYASPMSPFMSTEKMTEMIEFYNSHDYDSVVSVGVNKDFYFMDGKPVNFSLDTPPNSQDLQTVNNLTFGCCIIKTKKALQVRMRNRFRTGLTAGLESGSNSTAAGSG